MSEIIINGNTLQYEGEPWTAFCLRPDGHWGGRTNMEVDKVGASVQLRDLRDCYSWLSKWKGQPAGYVCGYILNYATGQVYYDRPEAIRHLEEELFPARELEGHFQTIFHLVEF